MLARGGRKRTSMELDPPLPHSGESDGEEDPLDREHRVWKKNAPLLYDSMVYRSRTTASFTVEWSHAPVSYVLILNHNYSLPRKLEGGLSSQRLLLGSHLQNDSTDSDADQMEVLEIKPQENVPNFLIVAEVRFLLVN